MIALWLVVLVVLTLVMGTAYWVQRRVGNVGWVDVFWTFGTGAGGVVCALLAPGGVWGRKLMLACMLGFWSLRLGSYVARRVAGLGREDVRYARFRKEWGSDFQRRMVFFIMVQAPISAVLSGAVLLASHTATPFVSVADGIGLALFVAAILVETTADAQMKRFRADRSTDSKVCDRGLWSISRHPNYVGELLVWCSLPIIALGNAQGWEIAINLLSLGAPATMYWLLIYVSGIPPLEREMLATRGDAYRDYQYRVAAFLPGFPSPVVSPPPGR